MLTATAPLWGGTAPAPDEAVQAQMQQLVEAASRSEADLVARIDRLAEQSVSREGLLEQILLFLRDSGGTEEAMTGALVMQHLRFSDAEKIAVATRHLATEDGKLRQVVQDLLATIDRSGGGEPDFDLYVPLLGGTTPPPELVRYLFSISPMAALQALSAANPSAWSPAGNQDVEAVDGLLRQRDPAVAVESSELRAALDSLERLSRSGVWWVRLYAAEVMRLQPSLAAAAVQERLAADVHPLVRKAAIQP